MKWADGEATPQEVAMFDQAEATYSTFIDAAVATINNNPSLGDSGNRIIGVYSLLLPSVEAGIVTAEQLCAYLSAALIKLADKEKDKA